MRRAGGSPHRLHGRPQVTKAEIQELFAEDFALSQEQVRPRADRPAPEERLIYLRAEAMRRAKSVSSNARSMAQQRSPARRRMI